MYPENIEIENPGGLYQGLTMEDIGKRSVRRNRLIADFLHRAHYIERVGSGFDRMKQSLKENNNPELEISATNFFNIRFQKRLEDINISLLTRRQVDVYNFIQNRRVTTKKEISTFLTVSEDTALRELNALLNLKLIAKAGTGKATNYTKI
jgi:ATP-dependent DNA helicase RecG